MIPVRCCHSEDETGCGEKTIVRAENGSSKPTDSVCTVTFSLHGKTSFKRYSSSIDRWFSDSSVDDTLKLGRPRQIVGRCLNNAWHHPKILKKPNKGVVRSPKVAVIRAFTLRAEVGRAAWSNPTISACISLYGCSLMIFLQGNAITEWGNDSELPRHDSAHGPRNLVSRPRKFGVKLVSNTANSASFAGLSGK
jgi:hypothetical protein